MGSNPSVQLWKIPQRIQYQKEFTKSKRTLYVRLTYKIVTQKRIILGQVQYQQLLFGTTSATYYVTIQLVFGIDIMIIPAAISYQESIMRRKQNLMEKNNPKENRKPHRYIVHEKVLVRDKIYKININKKYEDPNKCPYPITKVWTNKIITIRRDAVHEQINIR